MEELISLNTDFRSLLVALVLGLSALLSQTTGTLTPFSLGETQTSKSFITELKPATTTVFWVGESANRTNSNIANYASAWDTNWQENFGGVDDPDSRCGYQPCDFSPRENPFYVALPYTEFASDGSHKDSLADIPWYREVSQYESLLKNRWVVVQAGASECYGQWQDVGPVRTDDFVYVFGAATEPQNTFGVKAGLDISPALRDCLGVGDVSRTNWAFVEATAVPEGPWTKTITRSGLDW